MIVINQDRRLISQAFTRAMLNPERSYYEDLSTGLRLHVKRTNGKDIKLAQFRWAVSSLDVEPGQEDVELLSRDFPLFVAKPSQVRYEYKNGRIYLGGETWQVASE